VIVPDVNVLIHAMDVDSRHHKHAWKWWSASLGGSEHIGFSWPVLMAYVRLTTHPRIMGSPMDSSSACDDVRSWLSLPTTMVLTPGPEHMHVVARLFESAGGEGDLVPDAHLAALAIENGGTVYSQDADFARFPDVRWVNPLAG
jgi:toxin-antitoxin system PIN domain toxin